MQKTEKKKVLFLGGSNRIVEMVRTAKEMGVYTIVTDPVYGAPAKKYADASYDINTSDIQGLLKIRKAEELDGVYAMLGDVTTWNALALCKRLNVPFYLPKGQRESMFVIDKFKEFCRTFNVSVIDESELSLIGEETNKAILEFPLVLSRHAGKQEIYAIV